MEKIKYISKAVASLGVCGAGAVIAMYGGVFTGTIVAGLVIVFGLAIIWGKM